MKLQVFSKREKLAARLGIEIGWFLFIFCLQQSLHLKNKLLTQKYMNSRSGSSFGNTHICQNSVTKNPQENTYNHNKN